MKTTLIILTAALSLTAFSAAASKPKKPSIVDIVLADDGEFDVLQAAVIRAGLVEALSGRGQYTVFAPTDEAFITLLGAASEAEAISTIQAFNVPALTNILLYHVTEGRRNSRSIIGARQYTMLNEAKLTRAELIEAGIAETNIPASNGIIHVIDSVLIPQED